MKNLSLIIAVGALMAAAYAFSFKGNYSENPNSSLVEYLTPSFIQPSER